MPWIPVVLLVALVVVVFGVVLLAGALRLNGETEALFPLPGRYASS